MTSYPLHERLHNEREKIDVILDFLDALPGLKHELHYTPDDFHGRCYAAIPHARLVYQWLKIDPDALKAEREQMMAELRSSASLP